MCVCLQVQRQVKVTDVLSWLTWSLMRVMQDAGRAPNTVHLQWTTFISGVICGTRTSGMSEASEAMLVTSD